MTYTTHITIGGHYMHVAASGELEAVRSCDPASFDTFQQALDAGLEALRRCDMMHIAEKLSICNIEVDNDEA